MSDRKNEFPGLSAAQREIMEIVWERGEISASAAREILSARRSVARNTVRTLMERMEAKGWLTHREEGRTHLYSAARSRDVSIGHKVVEVLDQVCGGSPEALMAALIDFRGLKPGELARIHAMLEAARTRKPRSGGRS